MVPYCWQDTSRLPSGSICKLFNLIIHNYLWKHWNTNLLPPKPKSSFIHLKQDIQEFHKKYVLVPADKAANNIVVVFWLHYIDALKQELNGTKAYERHPLMGSLWFIATQMKYLKCLLLMLRNAKTGFLRCIGYPSFIKDRIKLGSLQILALVQLQNFQNY